MRTWTLLVGVLAIVIGISRLLGNLMPESDASQSDLTVTLIMIGIGVVIAICIQLHEREEEFITSGIRLYFRRTAKFYDNWGRSPYLY